MIVSGSESYDYRYLGSLCTEPSVLIGEGLWNDAYAASSPDMAHLRQGPDSIDLANVTS